MAERPLPDSTLLLVSLGPIQDFIASARRCQDLWFGSYLLSALSRATAEAMERAAGTRCLVFPASLHDDDSRPAVANKILLRVPRQVEVGAVVKAGKDAMAEKLRQFADTAFSQIPDEGYFYRERAKAQLDDLMELDWVSVPEKGTGNSAYAEARDEAERWLAARKNTRSWPQVGPWAGPVPKSSLDGLRESVLDEKLYDKVSVERRRRKYYVKKAERLCGVGLLKRVGADIEEIPGTELLWSHRPAFHSTSHVAAGPFRARLAAAPNAQQSLHQYFDQLCHHKVNLKRYQVRTSGTATTPAFRWDDQPPVDRPLPRRLERDGDPNGYDAYLLYEDRLRDILEESMFPPEGTSPQGNSDEDQKLRKAQINTALKSLTDSLRAIYKAAGRPPTAYFAMLLADGDAMGQAIDKAGQEKGVDGHQAIGAALDDFSKNCPRIVQSHGGSLIYAGGDDVLALLPLHTALACAQQLHDAFGKAFEGFDWLDQKPTLSVGLAVAHHMDDMAHARELAQRAEKLAKGYKGPEGPKDALGLVLDKRSGGTLELQGSWKPRAQGEPTLRERIDLWARLLHAEGISDKAAFDLEEAVAPLLAPAPGNQHAGEGLNEVAEALARRVLLRKRSARGSAAVDWPVIAALRQIFGQEPAANETSNEVATAVRQLSHELQTARVFLEAYQVAYGEVKS